MSDIVERLRGIEANRPSGWIAPTEFEIEAADEIVRLRACWKQTIEEVLVLRAERDRLRDALAGTTASLIAAISILRRAQDGRRWPSHVTASSKMFEQMMRDYQGSAEVARAALKGDTQ